MTNTQLEYLVEIVHSGSINKAAKKLFISQSTISNALKSLEQEFGQEIFIRTNKGISLTQFGHQTYQSAIKILDEIQILKVQQSLPKTKPLLNGIIHMGISPGYGTHTARILYHIIQNNPTHVYFDMKLYDFWDSVRALRTADISSAFISVPEWILEDESTQQFLQEHEIHLEVLLVCNMLYIVNPTSRYSAKNMITEEEAMKQVVIGYNGFLEKEYTAKLRADDFQLLCEYVKLDNRVVGLVDEIAFNMNLSNTLENIVVIPSNKKNTNYFVYMIREEDQGYEQASKYVAQQLADEFRIFL